MDHKKWLSLTTLFLIYCSPVLYNSPCFARPYYTKSPALLSLVLSFSSQHCTENGAVTPLDDGLPDFYTKRVLLDRYVSLFQLKWYIEMLAQSDWPMDLCAISPISFPVSFRLFIKPSPSEERRGAMCCPSLVSVGTATQPCPISGWRLLKWEGPLGMMAHLWCQHPSSTSIHHYCVNNKPFAEH